MEKINLSEENGKRRQLYIGKGRNARDYIERFCEIKSELKFRDNFTCFSWLFSTNSFLLLRMICLKVAPDYINSLYVSHYGYLLCSIILH